MPRSCSRCWEKYPSPVHAAHAWYMTCSDLLTNLVAIALGGSGFVLFLGYLRIWWLITIFPARIWWPFWCIPLCSTFSEKPIGRFVFARNTYYTGRLWHSLLDGWGMTFLWMQPSECVTEGCKAKDQEAAIPRTWNSNCRHRQWHQLGGKYELIGNRSPLIIGSCIFLHPLVTHLAAS